MRVGVIFGGPSPEHDVSILTGLQAGKILEKAGFEVYYIYWTKAGEFFEVPADKEAHDFVEGPPKDSRRLVFVASAHGGFFYEGGFIARRPKRMSIEALLNACHGGPGEDGSLQAALDIAGMRYTGPSFWGAVIGMDKYLFHCLVHKEGLPVLPRQVGTPDSIPEPDFDPPFIVKPRYGGSSIGIEVVADRKTLGDIAKASVHLRDGFVVEPYLPTLFDINIAVRTWPEIALSAIERPLRGESQKAVLDYELKYMREGGLEKMAREIPAKLDPELEARVRDIALKTAEVCLVRSVARIDFLTDGKELYLNELNTIPGALATYLWIDPPIDRAQLLSDMLEEAAHEPARRFTVAGAEGSLLKVAASIASKLA